MMRRSIPPTLRYPTGRRVHGFTLVELIVVIVVMAIIGTTLAIFIKPSMDAFIDVRNRADLADQADTSLRRMLRDVRHAVPNSLRVSTNSQCFELVPAVSGGRYRMGPSAAANPGAAYVDTSQPTASFDTLSELSSLPAQNDWVIINNQHGNDVYDGLNRTQITAVATPDSAHGHLRLTVNAMQVSPGYNGGRFQIVKNNEQSVVYICSGADNGVNGNGNGKGALYRLVRNFTPAHPNICPSTTGAVLLATNVQSCTFVYDPNQGATQQSGFLWMELLMTRNNESAKLAVGAHVMNVP
jgi:MSHA biogenesis protein MshO